MVSMALGFHANAGDIVICDYSTGFKPPEMVKVRPVVVISPRRRGGQLVTVVPLSSAAPSPVEPWHYLLPEGAYPPARGPVWVKADMIATIALARLDRVKMRGADGSSVYQVFRLGPDAMRAIGLAVKAALNLP
jgi:mRNA interferase MazF